MPIWSARRRWRVRPSASSKVNSVLSPRPSPPIARRRRGGVRRALPSRNFGHTKAPEVKRRGPAGRRGRRSPSDERRPNCHLRLCRQRREQRGSRASARPADRRPDGGGEGADPRHHQAGAVDADGGQPRQALPLCRHARRAPDAWRASPSTPRPASSRISAAAALPDSMAYIATDRSGRFLLGASYRGHKVTVNPIGAGTVQPAQQIIGPSRTRTRSCPTRQPYVLVPTLGNDTVNQFRFDAATGKLTPNDPPAVGVKAKAGPRHFVSTRTAARLPARRARRRGLRLPLRRRDRGRSRKSRSPARCRRLCGQALGRRPAHHARRPIPLRLRAHVRARSPASGSIPPPARSRPSAACRPRSSRAASTSIPSGRYLLAVGQLSHGCRATRIDRTSGELAKLKEYPIGKNPNWVEIVDLP